MKNILIINGHPNSESLCHALTQHYAEGAKSSGAHVEILELGNMNFDPNLKFGYQKRTELEPDLIMAQEKIKWANHIVIVFPVWWGLYPAIMKGFLDRTLLPGFAFKYRENSVWWDKLLPNKTGRIIYTVDAPLWYYRWINRRPAIHAMKKMTMEFCGIKPVKTYGIGSVRHLKKDQIEKELLNIRTLGQNMN